MILKISDWTFQVNVESTRKHTAQNAQDHCECGYCKNYYTTVDMVYPDLRRFLDEFGVNLLGPSELMPFEPTLLLACYRVQGRILTWGQQELFAGPIPVCVETADDDSFFLWVGEMSLPWCMEEAAEDVISPANTPEFMERMMNVWLCRYGEESIIS